MAETLHIDPSTEAATLSKALHAVCLEAAWEIEAMTVALPGLDDPAVTVSELHKTVLLDMEG